MKQRVLAMVIGIAVLLVLGISTASPAQPIREITVAMTSYKFEPSLVAFNAGDRVVLHLENNDHQRPHTISSPYFSTVDVTARGQVTPGTTRDGWKTFELEPGTKGDLEFIAHGHGQWAFISNLFNHAENGQTGAFIVWPAGYHPRQ